ncbi:substrate-binding domain-containing protein [Agathobaculum sp. NTUH-O15-33]|uniref:sugar ABC transporter substrate-binding protein n=1 Tax=Agathobaculum sp. NTUH-O15-33 TaxID=3079302 RepID=UPI0029585A94|nr:substrate-binding domain-containing protein [Agathobaculum sp. NTUH-O15-33]WNX84533.1 substrate-binding domain-containing protein [Agathobaculum sp. NTUH-O15-33]
MKKVLSLTLGLCMLLGFTGCGGQTGTPDAEGNADIALLMAERDEFLSVLEQNIESEAAKAGYELQSYDAGADPAKQMDCIAAAKNSGAKVLIVNLTESELAANLLEETEGMKVVFVNRCPADRSLLNENTVYIGADETTSGRLQGEALAAYFEAAGKKQISYLLLSGRDRLEHTVLRTQGALVALEQAGIQATPAVEPLVCDYDRAKAQTAVENLPAGTTYDCIISNNDAMALGALAALEPQGDGAEALPVVGVDLLDDAKVALAEGKMLMTARQDAAGEARGAVRAAINLLEGKPFDEGMEGVTPAADSEYAVYLPFEAVTAQNVSNF